MNLQECGRCTTRYALGLLRCPHCQEVSTLYREDEVAKIAAVHHEDGTVTSVVTDAQNPEVPDPADQDQSADSADSQESGEAGQRGSSTKKDVKDSAKDSKDDAKSGSKDAGKDSSGSRKS